MIAAVGKLAPTCLVVGLVAACGSGGAGGSTGGGAALPANSVRLSRADFGKDWPFTVSSGVLTCDDPGAVTFTADGTTYAVNGTASGLDKGADVKAIWKKDPTLPGARINIGPIIDRGLKLCG